MSPPGSIPTTSSTPCIVFCRCLLWATRRNRPARSQILLSAGSLRTCLKRCGDSGRVIGAGRSRTHTECCGCIPQFLDPGAGFRYCLGGGPQGDNLGGQITLGRIWRWSILHDS